MIYAYTAYNLVLHLCFPCPPLAPAPPGAEPDVVVTAGRVPFSLEQPVCIDPQWQAEPGRFLWRGGKYSGRFLVEGGRQVTLERNPAAEEPLLGFQFMRSVLAAVLRQRGLLTLHASTVVVDGGAVAVSGLSGAGKSTTVSALMARGFPLLADDLTALTAGPDGGIEALPGVPQLYLCEDAMQDLEEDATGSPFYSYGRLKRAVRPPQSLPTEAVPLRSIFLLEKHDEDDLRVRLLSGAERFAALQECVYGPLLPQEHPDRFALFAAVVETASLVRISRPAARHTLEEVVEVILRG
jgi:hypothetical protein